MATVIGGRYEVTARLGKGGMATIYGARDRRLMRDVAIKVLDPNLVGGKGLRLFNREARAIASLRHNHIVQLYDYSGPEESPPYIVMELVEGFNLDYVIKRYSPLPEPVILVVLARVASALAHAHERGVIHRDLKPANVMLERAGRVLLADFGIAKAHENPTRLETVAARAATNTGVIGTPGFMAPEQLVEEPVGPPADIFSLGSLVYCIATGASPFEATTDVVEILRRVVDVEFNDLLEERPDLSRDLALQVDACLQRDPEVRPTAEEVEQLCNVWLHQQEIHAPERVIAELVEHDSNTTVSGVHLDTDDVVVDVTPGDGRSGTAPDHTTPVPGGTASVQRRAPVKRGPTAPAKEERGQTEVVRTVQPAPMTDPRARQQRVSRPVVAQPEFVSGTAVSGPTAVVQTLDGEPTDLVTRVQRQPSAPQPVARPRRSGLVVVVALVGVGIAAVGWAVMQVSDRAPVVGKPVAVDPVPVQAVPVQPVPVGVTPVPPVTPPPTANPSVAQPAEPQPAVEPSVGVELSPSIPAPEIASSVNEAETETGPTKGKQRRKTKRGRRKSKPSPQPIEAEAAPVAGKGVIEVLVKPWGTVYVDGVKQGNTPVFRTIAVKSGRHTITVRHPTLGEVVKTVTIDDGDHDVLRIDLNP